MTFQKRQNYKHREQVSGRQGLEMEDGIKKNLGDKISLYHDWHSDYMIVSICKSSWNCKPNSKY